MISVAVRREAGWGAILVGMVLFLAPCAATASESEPNFLHGVGKVIGGVLFELPKMVLEATVDGPPVVGTAVGILAGTAHALQTIVAGLAEMAAGFNPWGSKHPS